MDAERHTLISHLLTRAGARDERAHQQLRDEVYEELRRVAGGLMRNERPSHTLCATALVNEAYVRLVDETVFQKGPAGENRARFFGAAAKAMRRLLVEHARSRGRVKRGGGQQRVPMDIVLESLEASLQMGTAGNTVQILDLNETLEEFEAMDPRAHDVVVMRFFGGLTVPEVASCLGISPKTVEKDWTEARAWLRMKLGERGT